MELTNDQISILGLLISNAAHKDMELKEANAQIKAYASQIIQLSGVENPDKHRVNWDTKSVELIPTPPKA